MRKEDISIIKMKEYNPPIHFNDDLRDYYHNGFMDAFKESSITNQVRTQHVNQKAWSKGYEDGLDTIARPK